MIKKEIYPSDLSEAYKLFLTQAESLIDDNCTITGNLANIAALLNLFLKDINWVGFYLLEDDMLKLGPFQGKPACTSIRIGKGVCGTAVIENKIMVVPDVHEFAGHIACDSNSNSEIVLPIHQNGRVIGVLDIDSPLYARFNEIDIINLSSLVDIIQRKIYK